MRRRLAGGPRPHSLLLVGVCIAAMGCGASSSTHPDAAATDAHGDDDHAAVADATTPGMDVSVRTDATTSADVRVIPPPDVPHTVGSCDHLPAVGVWEKISPIPGDNPMPTTGQPGEGNEWGASTVTTSPTRAGTVYAAAEHAGVFRSTDCGSTWTKTNTGRNGQNLDTGAQFWIRIVPRTDGADTLYVNNWTGNDLAVQRSTNSGVDWDPLYGAGSNVRQFVALDGWASDMTLDPLQPEHMLVTFHADCMGTVNAGCLGLSTDSGNTWTLVNGPLGMWQEGAIAQFIDANTWVYSSHPGIYYTANAGRTWEMVRYPGASGPLYRAQSGVLYEGGDDGVLTSRDNGHTWTMLPGSHRANTIVSTGTTMYAGSLLDPGVLWSAPESDPTTWTRVPTPTSATNGGAFTLAYDVDHHVLYSANHRSGLWRMVVR